MEIFPSVQLPYMQSTVPLFPPLSLVINLLFTKQDDCTVRMYQYIKLLMNHDINPLHPKSDLQILLCIMPDNFMRQRETP